MTKKTLCFICVLLIFFGNALVIIQTQFFSMGWLSRWSSGAVGGVALYLGYSFVLWLFSVLFFNKNQLFIFSIGILLYLFSGVGFLPAGVTVFLFLSCFAIGHIVSGRRAIPKLSLHDFALDIILGLAFVCGFFSILVSYKINWLSVYVLLLGAPLVYVFVTKLGEIHKLCASFVLNSKRIHLGWLILIILIGYVARYSFFPSVNYDDNALHLNLWVDLQYNHLKTYNLENQIWGVAPYTVALLHGIVSLLAGGDARSALNLVLFLGMMGFFLAAQSKSKEFEGAQSRIFGNALFLSTPIICGLLTGLQTELMFLFLLAAYIYLYLSRATAKSKDLHLAVCAIFSLLISTKLTGLVLSMFLFLGYWGSYGSASLAEIRAFMLERKNVLIFVALLCFAFFPYMYAWFATGNPLFPLYNGIFKSPYFAHFNFVDMQFFKGRTFDSLIGMFFDSGKYYESDNFIAGFQYLLILPIAFLLLFFSASHRKYLFLVVPAFAYTALMFYSVQYYRYLVPVLIFASFLILLLISWMERISIVIGNVAKMLLLVPIGINLVMMPGVSWYFNRSPESVATSKGKENFVAELVPEQKLNDHMNEQHPGLSVLYDIGRPFGATLAAKAYNTNWYSPKFFAFANNVTTSSEIKSAVDSNEIDYAYAYLGATWFPYDSTFLDKSNGIVPNYRSLLTEYLSQYGLPESKYGAVVSYKLQSEKVKYKSIFNYSSSQVENLLLEEKKLLNEKNGVMYAQKQPRIISTFPVDGYSAMRFSADLICQKIGATYIAQVNWGEYEPYYRLVSCNKEQVSFSESTVIPRGAVKGEIFVTQTDDSVPPIVINNLKIEVR